ncbi:hypothetical protein CEY09_18775 [Achromobacter marplatensis]|uniref:Reverse transcriptase (RNA-dependent DNA polymerase) n=1 Tax=Achromobacter marplatensis TaxID=470868 RepID=A0ABX9GFZ6_9BURK|nr:reverse transcriptase family protein [Achromobacter marplatensis]OWT66711.1 hypothetical protein CEY09_18775 [Achromobacter marplatensis]RBP21446.1 reverse transcriptase (RNA-dependent DNA polymerase) [Achromobacter marplatensis]CAB3639659.1 hypothetical protein LMG26219_01946 [Achromobacter marplatensis]
MAKRELYDINQCALYRLGSKTRLSILIGVPKSKLLALVNSLENYRVFPLPQEVCQFTGKVRKERLVQEPKPELRRVHERIHKLLSRVRPPEYGHAAVRGRSYRSNAEAHINGRRVATFDVRRFYPSTSLSAVRNFFADQLCCAPDVADILARLCCYRNVKEASSLLGLPTGSPLSPLLSLYANKPLFDALYHYAGRHKLVFTCYVDDLTFSGALLPRGLSQFVTKMVESCGHTLAQEKTRFFRSNQVKHVTGIVISDNEIKVPHARFLKARAIASAIAKHAPADVQQRLLLQRKLAGLLGEAAFLDGRYAGWANRSYVDLRAIQEEARAAELHSPE